MVESVCQVQSVTLVHASVVSLAHPARKVSVQYIVVNHFVDTTSGNTQLADSIDY